MTAKDIANVYYSNEIFKWFLGVLSVVCASLLIWLASTTNSNQVTLAQVATNQTAILDNQQVIRENLKGKADQHQLASLENDFDRMWQILQNQQFRDN